MKHPTVISQEEPLKQHRGVFFKQLSLWQGVALLVSATVGAGVLGIPYAVAKVGVIVGIAYIVGLGLLVIGLHLLLGEIAIRTKSPLQLVGFAHTYIGKKAGWLMSAIFYISLFGAQLIYLIGEGESLQALFGGSAWQWSLVFFFISSVVIFLGMRTIKTVELVLTIGLLLVVTLIGIFSVPHIQFPHITTIHLGQLLFPYGVILFAFHAASAIPEVHTLLRDQQKTFKKTIIIAGILSICLYSIFALTVVGVTGEETTQIATIGLGNTLGPLMRICGNIFAALAMGTSYLLIALSLRDSLRWDKNIPTLPATAIVVGIPLIIFLLGLREFIGVMDIVGGVFISLESVLIVWIYMNAKKRGDITPEQGFIRHVWPLLIIILAAFSFGGLYSVINTFFL